MKLALDAAAQPAELSAGQNGDRSASPVACVVEGGRDFSLSTFTLDIDGKPTLVLRTKWRVNAEEFCRAWVQAHGDELATKGPYALDLPLISRPAITLRMARAVEKAAYEASAHSAQHFHDVGIVVLTNVGHWDNPNDGEPTNDPEQMPGEDDPQAS